MSLTEYMAWVKQEHPVVQQANIALTSQEAALLKSRGGLDPVLKVAYENKDFKETNYYDKFYTSFEVPTGLGVVFSGGYQWSSGEYLNPESYFPSEGLVKIGISVDLLKNLVYNPRNTAVKKAEIYRNANIYEQQLAVNAILKEAIDSYINWYSSFQTVETYKAFIDIAQKRYDNIAVEVESGNLAEIDLVEASLLLEQRKLSMEKAKLELIKNRLFLSNFLWKEGYPIQLKEHMEPSVNFDQEMYLLVENPLGYNLDSIVNNHPKFLSLSLKKEVLEIDEKLAKNNVLPSLNLNYNYIAAGNDIRLNPSNHQSGIQAKLPLFLRKERGALKMAKLKVQDYQYEIDRNYWELKRKIEAILAEIESYKSQVGLAETVLDHSETLSRGEWQKYQAGEGTLLFVNIREGKNLEFALKLITSQKELYYAQSKFYEQLYKKNSAI